MCLWPLGGFRPLIYGKHVLVRMDNTATVAYINHQGGFRSRRMSQLAHHLLLWSQQRLKSLHATHIPGDLNRIAGFLSRQVSRRVEASPDSSADLESVRPGAGGPVCFIGINSLPVVVLPDRGSPHWLTAGLGICTSMRFP